MTIITLMTIFFCPNWKKVRDMRVVMHIVQQYNAWTAGEEWPLSLCRVSTFVHFCQYLRCTLHKLGLIIAFDNHYCVDYCYKSTVSSLIFASRIQRCNSTHAEIVSPSQIWKISEISSLVFFGRFHGSSLRFIFLSAFFYYRDPKEKVCGFWRFTHSTWMWS